MSDALNLLYALRLEDGRRWGEAANEFQVDDARAILDPNEDDPRMHFLTRPRGSSKTTDLAGVALAALLEQLPAHSHNVAVAADADQGRLLVDAARGFVGRTPELASAVRIDVRRMVATKTGASVEVLPADSASAYGLRPHLAIADELPMWPQTPNARGVWEAVLSSMPKAKGSRLVCAGTAGDPTHWSYKVLEHAKSSRAWRVHEVTGPCPWIEGDALEEQRQLLTESQYARLHLNQWMAAEDRLVRPEHLAACVTLDGPQSQRPGVRYVVGVDVGLRRDRTAIAVCHRADDRVLLDRLHVFTGTREREVQLSDVEEAILQASREYNGARVLVDPWQAIGLAQRLRQQAVRVTEFSFTAASVGKLAASLYTLLRAQRLALPNDEALLDELAHVRLRETSPGVLRLDHDPSRRDDMAVALALCAQHLTTQARARPRITRGFAVRPGVPLPSKQGAGVFGGVLR